MVNGQTLKMLEEEKKNASMQPVTFEDLEKLSATSSQADVEKVKVKYTQQLVGEIQRIKDGMKPEKKMLALKNMNEMLRKAWAV